LSHRAGVRVVEHQRRRQAQPRHHLQLIAEFDCAQRVEAQLVERPIGLDRLRTGMAQHQGRLGPDQVQQRRQAGRLGQAGQLTGDSTGHYR
jgi:hypothetical protein